MAYQAYSSKGVKFIGAFIQSDDDDIRKFAETYRITFPVGRENGIAERFGVRGVPMTLFIDRNGMVIRRHFGIITYEELASDINALLR